MYPETLKYDVVFLKPPLTAEKGIAEVVARKEMDNVYAENGVLYFSLAIAKLSKSYLGKIITVLIYQFMTIRNWNTTYKLLKLMEK